MARVQYRAGDGAIHLPTPARPRGSETRPATTKLEPVYCDSSAARRRARISPSGAVRTSSSPSSAHPVAAPSNARNLCSCCMMSGSQARRVLRSGPTSILLPSILQDPPKRLHEASPAMLPSVSNSKVMG